MESTLVKGFLVGMRVEVSSIQGRWVRDFDVLSGAAVKNLKRLFPTDQSMVVIIDDRWEVWSHGPNLVKVVPCTSRSLIRHQTLTLLAVDFFVGMGDINSTYVKPRATDIPAAMGPVPADVAEEDDAALQDQIALKRAKALEDQLEARPLKRKQEELEKQTEENTSQDTSKDGVPPVQSKETVSAEEAATSATINGTSGESPVHHRQALLRNDDKELERVDKVRSLALTCELRLRETRRSSARFTRGSLMHCPELEVASEYHLPPNQVQVCRSTSG